jgi:hypothetical protein
MFQWLVNWWRDPFYYKRRRPAHYSKRPVIDRSTEFTQFAREQKRKSWATWHNDYLWINDSSK